MYHNLDQQIPLVYGMWEVDEVKIIDIATQKKYMCQVQCELMEWLIIIGSHYCTYQIGVN